MPARTFTAAHKTLRNTTIRATLPTGKPAVFQVNKVGLIVGLDEAWADHFRQFRDWQVEESSPTASPLSEPTAGPSGPPPAAFEAARSALARGVDSYKRTELDGIATMIGIDPAPFPNKTTLGDEIRRILNERGE